MSGISNQYSHANQHVIEQLLAHGASRGGLHTAWIDAGIELARGELSIEEYRIAE